MFALARLRLPDGERCTLFPGDIIGRMPSATLILDDPRVSEAHAMVSLRGAELQLLALRGMFAVDGCPASKVALVAGQELSFAQGLSLVVEEVELPDALPALEGDGLSPQILTGSSAILVGPPARVVPGSLPDADALLWTTGDRWRLRLGASTRDIRVGEPFVVGGRSFQLTTVTLERAGGSPTQGVGRVGDALRVVAAWDTVQIHQEGRPPVSLSGVSARLVSVLAGVPGGVSWDALASELWPDETDRHAQRRRLDVALSRLRARLRASGVRTDLVRATGAGVVELVAYEGDGIIDRS